MIKIHCIKFSKVSVKILLLKSRVKNNKPDTQYQPLVSTNKHTHVHIASYTNIKVNKIK